MMPEREKRPRVQTAGGYLHRVVSNADGACSVISHALKPLMVEARPRALMQAAVGASILAVPVALTEETWRLGRTGVQLKGYTA